MSNVREVCSIPHAFRDLLEGRACAALSTVMPDGQPQSTVVWCDVDGDCLLINTMRGFRKEKNMRAHPRVTLLAYEQRNPLRSLEVRGTVDRDDRGRRTGTSGSPVGQVHRARALILARVCQPN